MNDGKVQLGDVDLNLLVHLHELLETASVTEAARRLGITQSAMSYALRRLRVLFDDKLLVRGQGGMSRTPRAEALRDPLYRSLLALQDTLAGHEPFVPEHAERSFRLMMSDYMQLVILPRVVELVGREAPGVQLQVESFTDPEQLTPRLLSGELDLAIGGPLIGACEEIVREVLLGDRLCCAVAREHPSVGARLTLEDFVVLPHVLISPSGTGLGLVDEMLAALGHRRHIAVRVQSFLSAPFLVAASDVVITAPERILRVYAEPLGLRLLEAPVELAGFELTLLWSQHVRHDAAIAWLRQTITRACVESA